MKMWQRYSQNTERFILYGPLVRCITFIDNKQEIKDFRMVLAFCDAQGFPWNQEIQAFQRISRILRNLEISGIKKKSSIPGVPRTLELSSSPEIKRFEAFQQFQDLLIYQSTKHSEPSFFMEFSRMSLMCVYFFFVCVPKIPLIFF